MGENLMERGIKDYFKYRNRFFYIIFIMILLGAVLITISGLNLLARDNFIGTIIGTVMLLLSAIYLHYEKRILRSRQIYKWHYKIVKQNR